MISDVEILQYNEISEELRSDPEFLTIDPFHSTFFWQECAEKWHEDFIHKVYVFVSKNPAKILGFFSIRANEIVIYDESEKQFIPIVDVSFIDVNKNLEEETSRSIFRAFLEFIEFQICKSVTNLIGCRFIRIYLPTAPVKNANGAFVAGTSIIPYLEDLYQEMNYIDPPVKQTDKIRKIFDNNKKDQVVLVLKYFIRDLLTN